VLSITSATTVLLVLTDIWCPILFYVVYDLLHLYKKEVEVSDLRISFALINTLPGQYYEKNNGTLESDDRSNQSSII
jgi:hypothetical protein